MSSEQKSKVRRILLKISGEALSGESGFGIDPKVLSETAKAIRNVQEQGIQTVLVIGGGNIFRGAALQKAGFDRVSGDQMGMLATIMNGLAMREELKAQGGKCVLMSAYGIPSITTQYSATEGRDLLNSGASLIVAGGTGSPFFTTDTAAVLRAIELQCSEVLKATKVDGIYTADPVKNKDAVKFDALTFDEVIEKKLEVMDLTAFALLGGDEGTVVSD